MIRKRGFGARREKRAARALGKGSKPGVSRCSRLFQSPRCNGEGAELRFRGPRAAGPGAGGDLLCVCLKAFPPNRNKPLISLKGSEPRPCSAGGARIFSSPARISIFSARTLGLAGDERSSRFKPGLIFAAEGSEHGRCCRVCYPSIRTSLISPAHWAAAPPRSGSRPCLRAGGSARYHPSPSPSDSHSDAYFYSIRRACSSRRIPDPSLLLGSAPRPRC